MGFFFRRSATFGPIRLNFSKSGVGASIGVKGARITRTATGRTYITAGTHGFYYRETLPGRQSGKREGRSNTESERATHSDTISTAHSDELTDSSSEKLVQQLNERARMMNPALILYVCFAAFLLFAMFPPESEANTGGVMAAPDPPEITHPLSAGRVANAADEFSMLTGRYGEPNFTRPARSGRLARIPVAVAEWSFARINIAFVPNGCVRIYDQILELEKSSLLEQRRRSRNIAQCHPRPGWTIVAYHDADTDLELSASAAAKLLNTIAAPAMRTAPAEPESGPLVKGARAGSPLPPMISNAEARAAAQQKRDNFQAHQSRASLSSRIALTCSIPVLFMGFSVHRRNIRKRETQLIYELDSASKAAHDVTQQAFGCLSSCRRIWRVESESATSDWKRNAGAAYLVKRTAIRAGSFSPPRVKTNVPVPCLDLDSSKLYFLPDTILYWDHRGFGAVAYSDFQVTPSTTRFIEKEAVPEDAMVVDHTWRYVNKDGGPDRRFNDNRRFPVLQLGVVTFRSSGGMNIHLNTSNPAASSAFADRWNSRFPSRSEPKAEKRRRPDSDSRPRSSDQYAAAREVLGVREGAVPEEIAAAYHRLARMYHPDRVAGLAPDIQELAGRKMREINAAYEALKAM